MAQGWQGVKQKEPSQQISITLYVKKWQQDIRQCALTSNLFLFSGHCIRRTRTQKCIPTASEAASEAPSGHNKSQRRCRRRSRWRHWFPASPTSLTSKASPIKIGATGSAWWGWPLRCWSELRLVSTLWRHQLNMTSSPWSSVRVTEDYVSVDSRF